MSTKWVTRWKYDVAPVKGRPGIFKLRSGGYLVRGRVTNPRTGARKDVTRVLRDATLPESQRVRDEEMAAERDLARGKTRSRTPFATFAAQLYAEKVTRGKLASAASSEWWEVTLRLYLIPAFGHIAVQELTRGDVDAFVTKQAEWVTNGKPSARVDKATGELQKKIVPYQPRTANAHLRILRAILNAATERFDLPRNPFKGVEFHPEERAYTREAPNRVPTTELPKFLAAARALYPQFYVMIVLGFLLGVRPSHMRPLRRKGAEADVKWVEGVLLIRRSNTRTGVVMNRTKTGIDQEVALPKGMMTLLEEQAAGVWTSEPWTKEQTKSDLLFPADKGGMRARTCLDKPFRALSKEVGHTVTPRAMRRTFNNAARGAGVHDVVTRSISGHQTEEMQRHYSIAELEEQRGELGRLLCTMLGTEVK